MNVDERRRRILTVVGGLVPVGVAGCAGLEDELDRTLDDQEDDDDHDHDDHDHDDDHDDHDHDHGHELGHPEPEIGVEMVSDDTHHFVPHVVHVERGGTVTWTLESGSHDTVAYHPDAHGDQQRIPDDADPWASDLLSSGGETFERTFDVEGVYDYACRPHEGLGMVGSVVVGWPDPDDQPGLESPSESLPDDAIEQLEGYNEQVRDVLEAGEEGDHDHDDHDDHDQ